MGDVSLEFRSIYDVQVSRCGIVLGRRGKPLKLADGNFSTTRKTGRCAWYLGRSIVADLAVEATNETSALYKLNVPLGIEFIFGRNWGECH